MPKTPSKMGQTTRELHATASWCAEDVQEIRPEWDAARCNAFLMDNEDDIQCAMIEAGWEAIRNLIRWEEHK